MSTWIASIMALMLSGSAGACATPRTEPTATMPTPTPTPTPALESTHVVGARERVTLDPETWLQVEGVVIEDIAPNPDAPEAYPAGSGVGVDVVVAQQGTEQRAQLTELSAGYESRATKWFGSYRVSLVGVEDPHRAPRISLRIERVTDQRTAAPAVAIRAQRGRDVELDPRTQLRFLQHGHKRTMRDEPSPLLAIVEMHVAGEPADQQHLTLGPERGRLGWQWRDFRFTLTDHQYGEWMDLQVERLALELVRGERAPSPE